MSQLSVTQCIISSCHYRESRERIYEKKRSQPYITKQTLTADSLATVLILGVNTVSFKKKIPTTVTQYVLSTTCGCQ